MTASIYCCINKKLVLLFVAYQVKFTVYDEAGTAVNQLADLLIAFF